MASALSTFLPDSSGQSEFCEADYVTIELDQAAYSRPQGGGASFSLSFDAAIKDTPTGRSLPANRQLGRFDLALL